VLVDVAAADADETLAKGWAAYKEAIWTLKVMNEEADQDGWSRRRRYEYRTSPNETRTVIAGTMFANEVWTIWICDKAMQTEVFEPLGMRHTTFDFERALQIDHASAHGTSVDGDTRLLPMDVNYAVDTAMPHWPRSRSVGDQTRQSSTSVNGAVRSLRRATRMERCRSSPWVQA
jgi:hypothetical protein